MEHLKSTVEALMAGLSGKNTGTSADNPEQWLKKALTKKELRHIKVKYFRKGILGLSVDSSAWLYILSLQKEALLNKLKQESPGLKNINLRIGEIE
ncbi:DUF721 domain-containing protein [bacterium]|nr:MAG: DUF721 domain-containing protein [bacterium]